MEEMKLTSFDDFQDKNFGKVGTPARDVFEKKVADAIQAYKLGTSPQTCTLMPRLGAF